MIVVIAVEKVLLVVRMLQHVILMNLRIAITVLASYPVVPIQQLATLMLQQVAMMAGVYFSDVQILRLAILMITPAARMEVAFSVAAWIQQRATMTLMRFVTTVHVSPSDAHSTLLATTTRMQVVMMVHVCSRDALMKPPVIMIFQRDATMHRYAPSLCSHAMTVISLQLMIPTMSIAYVQEPL
jgi:hypothetical protein